jgi:hypothetical protein
MSLAICIRCGFHKRFAAQQCPRCGLKPSEGEPLARSIILSTDYPDQRVRSRQELQTLSAEIEAGHPYAFDEAEVAHVMSENAAALAVTGRQLRRDVVTWLAPPLGLLAVGFLLLRSC